MKKKNEKFYEKEWCINFLLILNSVIAVIVFSLSFFNVVSSKLVYIFCFISFALSFFYIYKNKKRIRKLNEQQKNTTDTQETYLIRGENLDRIVVNKFPRITDEQDWEYVKRIFPSLCGENPNSAVSILFGKSITELDGANKYLAGTFLLSNKKPRDIKMFLKGFHGDPAY